MDDFCEKVIEYLMNERDKDKVIALILRDIFLNELIYISYTNDWKQYHMDTKKWTHFDASVFARKQPLIYNFLSENLYKYVNAKGEFDMQQKIGVLKKISELCSHIDSTKNKEVFLNKAKTYFHIGL